MKAHAYMLIYICVYVSFLQLTSFPGLWDSLVSISGDEVHDCHVLLDISVKG